MLSSVEKKWHLLPPFLPNEPGTALSANDQVSKLNKVLL
jgi:hypothetical protein